MGRKEERIDQNASMADKLSKCLQKGRPFIVTPEDDLIQVKAKSTDSKKRDTCTEA